MWPIFPGTAQWRHLPTKMSTVASNSELALVPYFGACQEVVDSLKQFTITELSSTATCYFLLLFDLVSNVDTCQLLSDSTEKCRCFHGLVLALAVSFLSFIINQGLINSDSTLGPAILIYCYLRVYYSYRRQEQDKSMSTCPSVWLNDAWSTLQTKKN